MAKSTLAGLLLAACLLVPVSSLAAAGDATLFRLFLKDGTALVSYGEFARVGERVVFSMPTGAVSIEPVLHLVNIAASRIDWDRTNSYAEAARATHYLSTQAESDYAALSTEVANTLNEATAAPDATERLALVEAARQRLAEWPGRHFNYRASDVRQMLGTLDEAIAGLRVAAGASRFDISLSAFAADPPPTEGLEATLPPPTVRDAIEQTLIAARISESAAERESLLRAALSTLERDGSTLARAWVDAKRDEARATLEKELKVDRRYVRLSQRMLRNAQHRARMADVRGLERLFAKIQVRDALLGRQRPDEVASLVAAVQSRLDAARQARLAIDRWALRAPEFRQYRSAIGEPVDVLAELARLRPVLEDIKSLAGSTPDALAAVGRVVPAILSRVSAVVPPEELRAAHALLVSAAQMADNAARIRREATLSGDMARAWDASSSAAGALMLAARAKSEIEAMLRAPQLSRER